MELIENQTEYEETPKTAPVAKKPSGLAGKDFGALFRADHGPRRVEFTVTVDGESKDCFVELLPLDKDHRNEIMRLAGGKADAYSAPEVLDYIVGHTLKSFTLWHRPFDPKGDRGQWQQIRPVEGRRGIEQQIRQDFKALPEFWDALVLECMAENGFAEDDVKN